MAAPKVINEQGIVINVISPFVPDGRKCSLQIDFDQTYKTIEIVDYAEKIGEADTDYVIKQKVVVTERPIQEVIDQDKDSVGVENIIKQVLRTGDTSMLPYDKGNCNVDLVGAPSDLRELKELGQNAENAFKNLPDDLTKGMDMKSFVDNMTQDQFDAFIKATKDRLNNKEVSTNE